MGRDVVGHSRFKAGVCRGVQLTGSVSVLHAAGDSVRLAGCWRRDEEGEQGWEGVVTSILPLITPLRVGNDLGNECVF